uniref:Uncharacterized protein n=1 Tax=Laticauda laticaudata TaxID=8630 RepID=A0A8C5SHX2_LATLA
MDHERKFSTAKSHFVFISSFSLGCPLRRTLYEGKCYYFSTLQKTWVESQKECAQLNSHLAIINNKAELVSR